MEYCSARFFLGKRYVLRNVIKSQQFRLTRNDNVITI